MIPSATKGMALTPSTHFILSGPRARVMQFFLNCHWGSAVGLSFPHSDHISTQSKVKWKILTELGLLRHI
jgi:hypothetical protein